MNESILGKRILGLLIISKALVVVWILINAGSGGMASSETVFLLVLMLPIFMLFLFASLRQISSMPQQEELPQEEAEKLVDPTYLRMIHLTFISYVFILFVLVFLLVTGRFGNELETNRTLAFLLIGLTETFFGLFVGKIFRDLIIKQGERKLAPLRNLMIENEQLEEIHARLLNRQLPPAPGFSEKKGDWLNALAEGELEKGVGEIHGYAQDNEDGLLLSWIVQQSFRLSQLEANNINGVISKESYLLERNKIAESIIRIIQNI
ncbi:MAG: hypothetical protein MRZ79_00060 [Bacteroidia bacterium]|nr:hypothetical protein [Bacteroidia bacterium]